MDMEEQCCNLCSYCMKLQKCDYSHGGCEHTDMEGFACTVFADEGIIEWMVGLNKHTGMCEAFSPKEDI